MNGHDGYDEGHHSGFGPEREPSEDRGQAAWTGGQPGAVPPWASAETQTGQTPPPWASAETRAGGPPPSAWQPPPPPPSAPSAGQVPTTVPVPAVAPAPRRGAGNALLAIVAVAVLGAGVGAGAWYLTRDNSTGGSATPATSVSVTTTPTTTSTPTQSAAPTDTSTGEADATASTLASASPSAGYRRAQDPVGYAIDVPQGWTRREKQGKLAPVVFYDDPGGGRQLQIFRVTEDTPYASLTLAESDPGFGYAKQPGYEVVERDRGDTWAELSYRYDDADNGPRQVVDHRFRAADGTLYAIRSSGPADTDPAQVREPLAAAVRSFCPTGAQCT